MARWVPPSWATTPSQQGALFLDVAKEGQIVESFCVDKQSHYILGRNGAVVDIPIDHPSCSRQHAALVHRADGSLMIIDLKSAHGSFFGQDVIEPDSPVALEPGEPFRFGASSRTYFLRRESLAPTHSSQANPMKLLADAGYGGESDPSEANIADRERKDARDSRRESPHRRRRSRSRSREKPRSTRWNEAPSVPAGAAQAQPRQSKFGPAVISAPLNLAPAQPLSAEDAQAAAAAFVRQHMGVSGQTVEQKKKMLWGAGKTAEQPAAAPVANVGVNRWDAAEFSDTHTQERFRKLMGVKGEAAHGPAAAGGSAAQTEGPAPADHMHLDKSQELQAELERQFYQGRRRQGGGTFGLGL